MHPRYLQCWQVVLLFLDICNLFMSSLRCKALRLVINFLVFWSICLTFSLIHFKVLSILQGAHPMCLSLWWVSCYRACFQDVFLFIWDTLFYFFFHLHLFNSVCFQTSQVLVSFLFSECSTFFLIWQFYSFCYLPFPQIPFLYPDSIFLFILESPIPFHFLQTDDVCVH